MQDVEQRRNAKLSGGLAQLGEHLLCKQGVVGSIPSSSTTDSANAVRMLTLRAVRFTEGDSLNLTPDGV